MISFKTKIKQGLVVKVCNDRIQRKDILGSELEAISLLFLISTPIPKH